MNKINGRAFFVAAPGTLRELMRPHHLEAEHRYEVVREITLSGLDYENFITDLYADRQFLADHAALCSGGEVYRCLLIRRRGGTDGVLVLPADGCFVGRAAYYSASAGPETADAPSEKTKNIPPDAGGMHDENQ